MFYIQETSHYIYWFCGDRVRLRCGRPRGGVGGANACAVAGPGVGWDVCVHCGRPWRSEDRSHCSAPPSHYVGAGEPALQQGLCLGASEQSCLHLNDIFWKTLQVASSIVTVRLKIRFNLVCDLLTLSFPARLSSSLIARAFRKLSCSSLPALVSVL